MTKLKKMLALVLAVCIIGTVGILSVSAASADDEDSVAADSSGITVHYYCEEGTPSIYYWNSLPQNISTTYPGVKMKSEGNNYYTYTFDNVTKINMLFVVNGEQSAELTRNTGEWWYKNSRWYSHDPSEADDWSRTDLREDSIYFVITTRFYDGDTGNNVHCWDDSTANNPDSDPAWRGDFKGLIEKLDYIKALGFSAIWITPVVTNASGYDYHGYHAFDFSTVDVRYESDGATYQDLIDAAHEKGMKIIQDVVWNHTSNFGEATLAPMFEKVYDSVEDLASIDCMQIIEDGTLNKLYPDYDSMTGAAQYQARLAVMKEDANDTNNYYHHDKSLSYGSYTEQTGQMAGDCVDINTENPVVSDYITSTFMDYVDMGVDAFRLDTEKHINRWTLNSAYFPVFNQVDNFYIFGEVCARRREYMNEGGPSDSCFFYTWKETDSKWTNNWSTTDASANYTNAVSHYGAYNSASSFTLTSDNAFLNGVTYHTPDYSQSNGTGTIDFTMHWNFYKASDAYRAGLSEDAYFNDATWNVVYVDSHDYSPDDCQTVRYNAGTQAWAENMDLMFAFRGIPCVYYGSEVEFMKGAVIDVGTNAPLSTTGRAYFGDYLEGSVTATDFSEYTASGTVAKTLASPLAVHLQQLNAIRRAVPALQKGQYTTDSKYVSGNGTDMAFIRRYTADGVDSLACVAISGGATFTNIPNGKYIDAVTGDVKTVTNGTLTVPSIGTANMRVYVCCATGFTGIDGQIGSTGTYLK
jgi:glycosidase